MVVVWGLWVFYFVVGGLTRVFVGLIWALWADLASALGACVGAVILGAC